MTDRADLWIWSKESSFSSFICAWSTNNVAEEPLRNRCQSNWPPFWAVLFNASIGNILRKPIDYDHQQQLEVAIGAGSRASIKQSRAPNIRSVIICKNTKKNVSFFGSFLSFFCCCCCLHRRPVWSVAWENGNQSWHESGRFSFVRSEIFPVRLSDIGPSNIQEVVGLWMVAMTISLPALPGKIIPFHTVTWLAVSISIWNIIKNWRATDCARPPSIRCCCWWSVGRCKWPTFHLISPAYQQMRAMNGSSDQSFAIWISPYHV